MSKTLKISLGDAGLRTLRNELVSLQTQIKDAEKTIPQDLANIGAGLATVNLLAMPSLDENDRGDISVEPMSNGSKVVHKGKQVAFLEYGTGMKGQLSPHPQAGRVGWRYNEGKNIFYSLIAGLFGWWYKRKFRTGIPSGRNMFKMAQDLKRDVVKISKGRIRI